MTGFWLVYRRWQRDRLVSTAAWTVGVVITVVATAAFYPSLSGPSGDSAGGSSAAVASLLGLGQGIDPTSPLGYLWIALYANVYPWMLMALGVVLGVAAIAGDEDTGTLEYLLSKPVTRSTVVLARYLGMVTILALVAVLSGLSLVVCCPLFGLDDGATAADVFNGTLSSFAVAVGLAGFAFLLGAVLGHKGLALGIATGVGIGGYVFYTLSTMTGSLEPLTWISPWRWYVADAMLVKGLTWNVVLPFGTALAGLAIGWWGFVRRDLRNP